MRIRCLALAASFAGAALAGCWKSDGPAGGAPKSDEVPLAGLDVRLEAAGAQNQGLPNALRLVVKNSGSRPARFVAPGPRCVATTEGDRKIRYPILSCVFWDGEGREGDTNFGPILADLVARRAPPPEEISLAPGEAWSREYAVSAFNFFGPDGPAASLEMLALPGDSAATMAVEIIEYLPSPASAVGSAPAARPEAREFEELARSEVRTSRRRTNAIPIKLAEGLMVFRWYTDAYQAEQLAFAEPETIAILEDGGAPPAEPGEIPNLLREFAAPDFSAHASAALQLLRLGPPAKPALPRMLELLKSAKLYGDRVLAARVIGSMGPSAAEAIPGLEAAMKDPHEYVRQEAIASLAKVRGQAPPPAVDRETGEPVVWGRPLRYWIEKMRMGDRGPGDRDFEESGRAHRALEKLGAKAVPALLEALKGDFDTRYPAIMILRKVADPAGLELIAAALRHPDLPVRRGAAEALAPSDLPLGHLPESPAPHFPEIVISRLVEALHDGDAEVRRHAASALGRPDARAAEAELAAVLSADREIPARAAAASSLGKLGAAGTKTLEALTAAAKEGPASVREAAAGALAALGKIAPPVEDEFAALRQRAREAGAAEERTAQDEEVTRAPGDPDALFFVIANGGSNMEELPRTKALVARLIESLPPSAEFGVCLYSARAVKFPADGKPARAEGAARAEGLEFVRATRGGSGSCIHLGFNAALEMIDSSRGKKIVVLYFGNGFPTCPGKEPAIYQSECLEEIAKRNHRRAQVHAYAAGACNAEFLQTLAGMNAGTFTRLRP